MYGKGVVSLLEDRTLSELGVDPKTITSGSHSKVFVKCTRCGEEFKREFRKLHQLHNCPTYRTIDDVRHKWCNACRTFKPTSLFGNNHARYDGLQSQCIACKQDKGASQSHLDKLRSLRSTFDGWLKRLVIQKKSTSLKYGIQYDLTVDAMRDQWQFQGGRCYYSKVPLRFNSASINGAQIDRIIPSLGYTIGNVVWASKGINNLKNSHSLSDLSEFIAQAVFDAPVRCEFIKLSGLARIPERAKDTDAGHDVYAIADTTIEPEKVQIIGLGFALVVPPNYYYTIEGRSSSWKHSVVPCRGIIDATYSGELKVAILNHNPTTALHIKAGDRIAQLVFHKVVPVDFVEVEAIDITYSGERGSDGFGSTGK